jgi:O-antigen ligase
VLLVAYLLFYAAVTLFRPEETFNLNVLTIGLAVAVSAFMFPGVALAVGVLSIAVSPQNFRVVDQFVTEHFSFIGMQALQKFFVLFTMLPAIMRYGLRPKPNMAILALIVLLLTSMAFGSRYPNLTVLQMFKTLIGFVITFAYFNIKLNERWIAPTLLLIAFMPVISIVLGGIAELGKWQAAGDLRPWVVVATDPETHAYRLQGINIAPALAYHCFLSLFICFYQAVFGKKSGYFLLLAVTLIILVLTGTRTPLLASIIFLGAGTVLAAPKDVRGSSKFVMVLGGACLLGIALAIYWPSLTQRFTASASYGESGINTSGRNVIWTIMLNAYNVNPIFGRGLGTGAILLLDERDTNLVHAAAAHNEYIRLLVDAGIVGLMIFILGIGSMIVSESRGIPTSAGRYLGGFFAAFAIYSFTDNTMTGSPTIVLFYAVYLIIVQAKLDQTGTERKLEYGGR